MLDKPEIAAPGVDVDTVDELVARILGFITSDQERLARFLGLAGFQPGTLREPTRSPLLVLSVLDTIAKDERLLHALGAHERIEPEMIALARARLVLQVVIEVTEQVNDRRRAFAARADVQRRLHGLLQR